MAEGRQAPRGAPAVPHGHAARLATARALMAEALVILDDFPASPAAATLDLAIHHLDRQTGG